MLYYIQQISFPYWRGEGVLGSGLYLGAMRAATIAPHHAPS